MCNSRELFEKLAPAGFSFCRTDYDRNREEYAIFKGATTHYPNAGYYDAPSSDEMAIVRKDGSVTYETWYATSAAQVNAILSAD